MKRNFAIISLFFIFITGLIAQETDTEKTENNRQQKKIECNTDISIIASYPAEALLGVTQNFTIPVMNFDNLLTKDSNIKFKLGADITPVSVEGKFGITWTPLAFLELYLENRIGTGWKIAKDLVGVGINKDNGAGISDFQAHNFKKAVYTFNAGGAIQFDLGEVLPNAWTHIIFKIDQFAVYKRMTGVNNYESWIYQADYGTNRNGWRYGASYILGYKMPIPLDILAVKIDTEKTFFEVPPGLDKKTWGEDKIITTFGPVINFNIKKKYNIMLIAQWKIVPAVVKEMEGDEYVFYQTFELDKNKDWNLKFRRVSIIFYMTLQNR